MSVNDLVAAFDVGSNTVRGLAAQQQADGLLRPVLRGFRTTALGRGLAQTGRLERSAMEQTADFVAAFVQRAGRPGRVWAVGTAAARDAQNAAELAELLRARAGVELQVISGEEEAELSFLGATSAVDDVPPGQVVVADPGGRSTELVAMTPQGMRAVSAPVGVRSLTERFVTTDPPRPEQLDAAWEAASSALTEALGLVVGRQALVVTGGTAIAAALLQGQWTFTPHQVRALRERLCGLDQAGRRAALSFDPERAEVICCGLVLVEVLAAHAPGGQAYISPGGVREGVLLRRTGARGILPDELGMEGDVT